MGMEPASKIKLIAATSALAFVCASAAYALFKRKLKFRDAGVLNYVTVTTEQHCDEVIKEMLDHIKMHRAVGFDCEWLTEHGRRHPVALLQLSSFDGYCGLFRLCHIKFIPDSLKALLEDETVYKVGVVPSDDAKYLFTDYGVALKSTLDVRHIALLCGKEPGGLAALSKNILGVILDKSWRIRCSNWQADELSEKQMNYAATDAHVAIRIFVNLLNQYDSRGLRWLFGSQSNVWKNLDELCWKYADVHFKTKQKQKADMSKHKEVKSKELTLCKPYPHATRTKPLYHNCYLEAPDGEMLCTCDNRKALWYVNKQLADIVSGSPLTVRLRFEPAGRSVGESGRYYTQVKENRCVVCAATNSYIRKNVVPREYRKYFPVIMKDHVSHDVVLLCATCHQTSNMRDQAMRERLAAQCHAPLGCPGHSKYNEDLELKKVRSAARALLHQLRKQFALPEARRQQLEAILLDHYAQCEITEQLLEEAANIDVAYENAEYESHGQKVTEHYQRVDGGLLALEQLWREHFLLTMRPRHMPDLWSVTHSEDRLRVRLNEGRLSENEIKLIGLTSRWRSACLPNGM